jgi:uncharacterized Zn-finger protein
MMNIKDIEASFRGTISVHASGFNCKGKGQPIIGHPGPTGGVEV